MKSLDSDTLLYNLYLNIGSEEDPLPSDKPVDKDGSFIDFSKWDRGSDRIVPPLSVTIERVTDISQDPETGNAVITYTDNNGRTQQIVSGNVNVGVGEDGSKQYNIDGMTFTTGEYQNQNQNQGQNNFGSGSDFAAGIGFGSGFGSEDRSGFSLIPELPYKNTIPGENLDEMKSNVVENKQLFPSILGTTILNDFRINIIDEVLKIESDKEIVTVNSYKLNDEFNRLDASYTYDKKNEKVIRKLEESIGNFDKGILDSSIGDTRGPTILQRKYHFIEKYSIEKLESEYKKLFTGSSISQESPEYITGFVGSVVSYLKKNKIFLKFIPTDSIIELISVIMYIFDNREVLNNKVNLEKLRDAIQNFVLLGQLRCYFVSEIINIYIDEGKVMGLVDGSKESNEITLFDKPLDTIILSDEAVSNSKLSLIQLIYKFIQLGSNDVRQLDSDYVNTPNTRSSKEGLKGKGNSKTNDDFLKFAKSHVNLSTTKEYIVREDLPDILRQDEVFFTRTNKDEIDLISQGKLPKNRTDDKQDQVMFNSLRKYLRVSTLLRMSPGSTNYHSFKEDKYPILYVNEKGEKLDNQEDLQLSDGGPGVIRVPDNRVVPTYIEEDNKILVEEFVNNYMLFESGNSKLSLIDLTSSNILTIKNQTIKESQMELFNNMVKDCNTGFWFTSNKIYEISLSNIKITNLDRNVYDKKYRKLNEKTYNSNRMKRILIDGSVYAVYSEIPRLTGVNYSTNGVLSDSRKIKINNKEIMVKNDESIENILRRYDETKHRNLVSSVKLNGDEITTSATINSLGSTVELTTETINTINLEDSIDILTSKKFKSTSEQIRKAITSKPKDLTEFYKPTQDILEKYTKYPFVKDEGEISSYAENLDWSVITPERAMYIISIFNQEEPIIAIGIREELDMGDDDPPTMGLIEKIFKTINPNQIINLYIKYLQVFTILQHTVSDDNLKKKLLELDVFNFGGSLSSANQKMVNSINQTVESKVLKHYIRDRTEKTSLMGHNRIPLSVLYEFLRDIYLSTLLLSESVYLKREVIIEELEKLYDSGGEFKDYIDSLNDFNRSDLSDNFEEIYKILFVKSKFEIDDYKVDGDEFYLYPLSHKKADIFEAHFKDNITKKLKNFVPSNKPFENEYILLEPMIGEKVKNKDDKMFILNNASFNEDDFSGENPNYSTTNVNVITQESTSLNIGNSAFRMYNEARNNIAVLGMTKLFNNFTDFENCLISIYLYLMHTPTFDIVNRGDNRELGGLNIGLFISKILNYTRSTFGEDSKFSTLMFNKFVPHYNNSEFNTSAWNLYIFSHHYDKFRSVFETVRRDILSYIINSFSNTSGTGGTIENLNKNIIFEGTAISTKTNDLIKIGDDELDKSHKDLQEELKHSRNNQTIHDMKTLRRASKVNHVFDERRNYYTSVVSNMDEKERIDLLSSVMGKSIVSGTPNDDSEVAEDVALNETIEIIMSGDFSNIDEPIQRTIRQVESTYKPNRTRRRFSVYVDDETNEKDKKTDKRSAFIKGKSLVDQGKGGVFTPRRRSSGGERTRSLSANRRRSGVESELENLPPAPTNKPEAKEAKEAKGSQAKGSDSFDIYST